MKEYQFDMKQERKLTTHAVIFINFKNTKNYIPNSIR